MSLIFDRLAWCVAAVILTTSVAALSQEEGVVSSSEPLSDVEDTTLDGSGSDAADAVNSVAEPVANDASQPNQAPAPVTETREEEPSVKDQAAEASSESPKDETPAEPEVPKTPVAEAEEPAKSEPAKETSVVESSVVKGTYGGRVFGQYRIQLSANRPTFDEGQKCYEKFYGKPETYLSISGDWFPLDWWINPGVTMRLGTYSVKGKALKSPGQNNIGNGDCDSLVADDNSKTSLLFLPIQLGVKVELTPFSRKWLVLDAWASGEYGWWQETRESATAMVRPIALLASDEIYTNTGRKRAISTGFSANILLNYLDERTVRSMIDTMGIGYVYLTGFMEKVTTQSREGLTFGRSVLGIGFTFETYK